MRTHAVAVFFRLLGDKPPGSLFALCGPQEREYACELDDAGWKGLVVCEYMTMTTRVHFVHARPHTENKFLFDAPLNMWVPAVTAGTVLSQIGGVGEAIIIGYPELDGQLPWGSWEARAVLVRHGGQWEEISNRMLLRGYNTKALDAEYICFARAPEGRTW